MIIFPSHRQLHKRDDLEVRPFPIFRARHALHSLTAVVLFLRLCQTTFLSAIVMLDEARPSRQLRAAHDDRQVCAAQRALGHDDAYAIPDAAHEEAAVARSANNQSLDLYQTRVHVRRKTELHVLSANGGVAGTRGGF
jgi:hypothetical protein